jgi:hypothetical protein
MVGKNACGIDRTKSRPLTHLFADRISSFRIALARRRAIREMEAMPFDIRKDIGWRS